MLPIDKPPTEKDDIPNDNSFSNIYTPKTQNEPGKSAFYLTPQKHFLQLRLKFLWNVVFTYKKYFRRDSPSSNKAQTETATLIDLATRLAKVYLSKNSVLILIAVKTIDNFQHLTA